MFLYEGPTSSQASLVHISKPRPQDSASARVVAICGLDAYFSLLNWLPIHFIKMDIEGAETLAIKGMMTTLERFHPTLLIESHGEVTREGLETLSGLGYKLECLDVHGNVETVGMSATTIDNRHWVVRIEEASH